MLKFHVVKFDNVQNVPYFLLFSQCTKALSKSATRGARCAIFAHLRKIWQHWSLERDFFVKFSPFFLFWFEDGK